MRQTKFLLLFILVAAGCTVDRTPKAPANNTPATAIRLAAIAIPDPYAADVAEAILRQGGNAVDAAVATGFALAVTYVDAGNIGGGGFMTTFMNGESAFLDYREEAPGAGNRDMYLDENGEVIENGTLIGGQAAATPGTCLLYTSDAADE